MGYLVDIRRDVGLNLGNIVLDGKNAAEINAGYDHDNQHRGGGEESSHMSAIKGH